jgi:hypothetical protein
VPDAHLAALATDGLGEPPGELGRAELAYGEWLRRVHRRSDARPRLLAALAGFERLGAVLRVERAEAELRASARNRDPSTQQQLTPRSGRWPAGRPGADQPADRRPPGWEPAHGRLPPAKVYAKLGITSRAELGELDLDDDDPG